MNDWNIVQKVSVGAIVVTVVIVALSYLYLRLGDRKMNRKTSGQVVGIVGKMGSGKTMAAVRIASVRIAAGVDVASNFEIDTSAFGKNAGRWAPFTGFDDLRYLRNCVVILDEAHLLAPSSHSKSFPMMARQILAFARKRGIDFYWISQHESRVNSTLRDLTTDMALCTRGFRGSFKVSWFEPEKFRKAKEKPYRVSRFRLSPALCEAYDTTQVIEMDSYLDGVDKSTAKVREMEALERQRRAKRATA